MSIFYPSIYPSKFREIIGVEMEADCRNVKTNWGRREEQGEEELGE